MRIGNDLKKYLMRHQLGKQLKQLVSKVNQILSVFTINTYKTLLDYAYLKLRTNYTR